MNDEFGDRMKELESAEAGRRLMPLLPAIARLDGKCFSNFTRGLVRPFDALFSECMVRTTKHLVEETTACCGYTQSDEITLGWLSDSHKSQIWFDGKIQKMVSVLAAMASVRFNQLVSVLLPAKAGLSPVFDCRVWNVPNDVEGANCFLWREHDATKNSISSAAQCHYSHKELMNKNTKEMQELLFAKGVNWNDYPDWCKRGTYIQRRTVQRKFTVTELGQLPPLHEARKNPDLEVERTEYVELKMPKFGSVVNRADVIFRGAEPIVATENTT